MKWQISKANIREYMDDHPGCTEAEALEMIRQIKKQDEERQHDLIRLQQHFYRTNRDTMGW
jgi:hypothetical protein